MNDRVYTHEFIRIRGAKRPDYMHHMTANWSPIAQEERHQLCFGVWGVIGKGGMAERTLAACREYGCVYFHAVGGAAQVLAECVKSVRNVYFLEEFGSPEAIWEIEVEHFPAVVTMDSHGNSLHKEVFDVSQAELAKHV